MLGLLGDMFDFNHDGNMGAFEQAMELSFITEVEKELLKKQLEDNNIGPDDFERMNTSERRDALERNGLNSNDYIDYDDL